MSRPAGIMAGRHRLTGRIVVAVILATRGSDHTVPAPPDSGPFNQQMVTYSPEASS